MSKPRKSRLLQRAEYVLYRIISRSVRMAGEDRVHRWGGRLGTLAGTLLRGRNRLWNWSPRRPG